MLCQMASGGLPWTPHAFLIQVRSSDLGKQFNPVLATYIQQLTRSPHQLRARTSWKLRG